MSSDIGKFKLEAEALELTRDEARIYVQQRMEAAADRIAKQAVLNKIEKTKAALEAEALKAEAEALKVKNDLEAEALKAALKAKTELEAAEATRAAEAHVLKIRELELLNQKLELEMAGTGKDVELN